MVDNAYEIFTNKTLFLIGLGLTPILSNISDMLSIEFLGFSVGALGFLTGVILVDFWTGIRAARYNGEEITSRKGYRSVDKLMSYFIFICFTALLQGQLESKNYDLSIWIISNFRILVFVMIFLWEFKSIGENYKKRYGTLPRLFKILDRVASIIESKIISRIENIGSKSTPEIKKEEDESQSDHVK